MEYLFLFQTHQERENFLLNETMPTPNISHCIRENEVHYNGVETRVIAKYNVTNTSEPTLLYGYYTEEGGEEYWVKGIDLFDKVEIDGVDTSITDLDVASGQIQLSAGEHTVKYMLKDRTSIVEYTFNGCSDITSVVIPNSVTSIGDFAFYECSGLTSVTIPNSVTSIGDSAFSNCGNLTSVFIPNSVTSIGDSAFGGCYGLTSIAIPNFVTTIRDSAFIFCSSLTSVAIPNSVTTIGERAFQDCDNLTNIVSLATTAPTIESNTFTGVKTNGTLTVPSGSSGYDVWMGTGNYYLGKYNWTKVEQ